MNKKFSLLKHLLLAATILLSRSSLAQNVGIGTSTPGSTLQLAGSFATEYKEITSSQYTIGISDYYLVFNGGFSSGLFTLPVGSAAAKGRNYFIKNGGVFTLMVKAAGGETIDGDSAVNLSPGEVAHIVMKGTSGAGIPTSEVVMIGQGSYSFFNAGLQGRAWSSKGNAGTNPDNHFIGTTDQQDFVTRTNGIERMRVTSDGKVGIGTYTPVAPLQVYSNVFGNLFRGVIDAEYQGGTDITSNKVALYGHSFTTYRYGIGVKGEGGYIGVEGVSIDPISPSGAGVKGTVRSDAGFCYGVYGAADKYTSTLGTKIGVYGTASGGYTNYAGLFDGDLQVNGRIFGTGALSVDGHGFIGSGLTVNGNFLVGGTKSFFIDHPLDPENKYLYHYCIESNEVLNVYSGNLTTGSDGLATAELPTYFESINKDFRYQLTVVGEFAQAIIKSKIENNRFVIETSKPNLEVSWMVTAVRNDKYMQAHPAKTEEEKEPENKGKYMQPAEWNQPATKGMHYTQSALPATANIKR
ncbi:MAG: hypothetical protein ABIX01_11685 [Chitinophagaceae bacterium]